MIGLYKFFALILAVLVVLFNHGAAAPAPDDFAPNHAGPTQYGGQHVGPSRPQHLGPPRGPSGIGSPVEISLYGH